jgi:hypothetical protein
VGVSHLPRHDQRFGRFAAAIQPRMAADFDHRLRHQDDLDHRVLADALAYRPWAIGQFGGAGAGPIHLPGDWTIVTPGPDGAIPIEALREEKALPCYVDEVGDCQDLRTYLIAQHGGMQIGDIGTGVLSVGEAGWPASWLRAVRCDFRRPGHQFPSDRTAPATGGRTQRAHRPARRRGIRRGQPVRWAGAGADRGTAAIGSIPSRFAPRPGRCK